MDKIETYCSGEFLDSIYKRIDCSMLEFLQNEKLICIPEIYRFLHGNCLLITDISEDEIFKRSTDLEYKKYNPHLKKLWKNGAKNFVSYAETFSQMREDNSYFNEKCQEIYFLSEHSNFCRDISNKHGLLCASKDDIDQVLPHYFSYAIYPISKDGSFKDWSFLKDHRYFSNSAVIADNHFLKDKSLIDDNLFSILRMIMPNELDEIFNLTIFTRDLINIDLIYELLRKFLEDEFPYEVELSIGIVEKGKYGIHDRDIITNYCQVTSGAGFNLFKRINDSIRVINKTNVYVYPITYCGNNINPINTKEGEYNSVQASYNLTLEYFQAIWKNLPDRIGNQKTFIGTRKNRLLDI